MKTSFVLGVVLSLSGLCFASQKSYNVTLSAPSQVSGMQLAAGDYKVKVDGANAIFTDSKSKTVSAPVKVENGAKKFAQTSVDASKVGTVTKVNSIELGGSTTRLAFTN